MKSKSRHGLKRAAAGLAIAVSALTATGCGYTHEQPTTFHYDASDGVSTDISDSIHVRNIMVVTNSADSEGRFLGTVSNDTDKDATVQIKTAQGETATVQVPAKGQARLEDDSHKTTLKKTGAAPGKMLENTEFSADGNSASTDVPVLDGALDEYRQYIPGGSSYSPQAEPTSSGSAEK